MASLKASRNKFSVEEATEMMMREGSRLREVRVAGISYKVRRVSKSRHQLGLTPSTGPLGTSRKPRKWNHIWGVQSVARR